MWFCDAINQFRYRPAIMNMLIGYLHGKNFLALDVYCYVDFQMAFPFYVPFIPHPLAPVRNLDTGTVYCNHNVISFRFPAFVFIYFYIQPVYPSADCAVIGDRWQFSFGVSLCLSFGLPIGKVKIRFGMSQ